MSDLKNNGQIFDDRYIRYDELGLEPLGPGTLWAMGRNSPQPVLGLGDTVDRNVLTQIGTATDWISIGAGSISGCGVRGNGTLWTWGDNSSYTLGLGDTVARNVPTQVGVATNWVRVESGINAPAAGLALRQDGTLWGWGTNTNGQLGLGDFSTRTTPTQIGTGQYLDFSINSHTLLVAANGTLWYCGDNGSGEGGLGVTGGSPTSVLAQIGTVDTWSQVSAGASISAAIRRDGTLWMWGSNIYGQIGQGFTSAAINVPTQVGVATDWKEVRCNGNRVFAIKNSGSLWGWGYNTDSGLSVGDAVHRNVPTQIGFSTSWKSLATASDNWFSAIRTDGTLWTNFNVSNYPTVTTVVGFVQYGAGTSWLSTACAQTSIFAIQAP